MVSFGTCCRYAVHREGAPDVRDTGSAAQRVACMGEVPPRCLSLQDHQDSKQCQLGAAVLVVTDLNALS
jgi:hypothetical protein